MCQTWRLVQFPVFLWTLTQESPNSLPNQPDWKLGPAPNNRAKAWSPSLEA